MAPRFRGHRSDFTRLIARTWNTKKPNSFIEFMGNLQELDKELGELKTFIAELKADRAAQKEKEAREAWTKYTAISLVCIAVLAAVANQLAGKYSGRTVVALNHATFLQAQASDKWTEYDTRSIKQNLYEALRQLNSGAAAALVLEGFNAKVAKYESENQKSMAEAKDLERQRNEAREVARAASDHGGGMGTAISVFQIAIALGSICLVTKKKPLWFLSLALTVYATVRRLQVWLG